MLTLNHRAGSDPSSSAGPTAGVMTIPTQRSPRVLTLVRGGISTTKLLFSRRPVSVITRRSPRSRERLSWTQVPDQDGTPIFDTTSSGTMKTEVWSTRRGAVRLARARVMSLWPWPSVWRPIAAWTWALPSSRPQRLRTATSPLTCVVVLVLHQRGAPHGGGNERTRLEAASLARRSGRPLVGGCQRQLAVDV